MATYSGAHSQGSGRARLQVHQGLHVPPPTPGPVKDTAAISSGALLPESSMAAVMAMTSLPRAEAGEATEAVWEAKEGFTEEGALDLSLRDGEMFFRKVHMRSEGMEGVRPAERIWQRGSPGTQKIFQARSTGENPQDSRRR